MSTDDFGIPKNSGKVIQSKKGKPVAVFRDEEGRCHTFSAMCPHKACDVLWNDSDKCWDCPCHGARFSPKGELIRGPAERGLYPKNIAENAGDFIY